VAWRQPPRWKRPSARAGRGAAAVVVGAGAAVGRGPTAAYPRRRAENGFPRLARRGEVDRTFELRPRRLRSRAIADSLGREREVGRWM